MVSFGSSASVKSEVLRARELLAGYSEISRNKVTTPAEKKSATSEFGRLLVAAQVDSRPIFSRIAVVCAVCFLFVFLFELWIFIGVFAGYVAFEYFKVDAKAKCRVESFEKDYTALLLSLASSVKTGLDPLVALTQSYQLFAPKSEVRKELEILRRSIDSGMSEEGGIKQFAKTIDHPDIALFRSAFLLARREGSSLAECLQRLARVTRQRQSFRRKAKAAVAMQKLSSFAIVGCCGMIGVIQFVANPTGFQKSIHDPVGMKIMGTGVLLLFVGVGWMVRIAKARI